MNCNKHTARGPFRAIDLLHVSAAAGFNNRLVHCMFQQLLGKRKRLRDKGITCTTATVTKNTKNVNNSECAPDFLNTARLCAVHALYTFSQDLLTENIFAQHLSTVHKRLEQHTENALTRTFAQRFAENKLVHSTTGTGFNSRPLHNAPQHTQKAPQ